MIIIVLVLQLPIKWKQVMHKKSALNDRFPKIAYSLSLLIFFSVIGSDVANHRVIGHAIMVVAILGLLTACAIYSIRLLIAMHKSLNFTNEVKIKAVENIRNTSPAELNKNPINGGIITKGSPNEQMNNESVKNNNKGVLNKDSSNASLMTTVLAKPQSKCFFNTFLLLIEDVFKKCFSFSKVNRALSTNSQDMTKIMKTVFIQNVILFFISCIGIIIFFSFTFPYL